ncbi:MAG: hypothetical protein H6832_14575 [Planctomycetes bacterium]|nr:hypothetical protein [Planctomycetota bacterium]
MNPRNWMDPRNTSGPLSWSFLMGGLLLGIPRAQSREQITTNYDDGAVHERYHVDEAGVKQGSSTEYWPNGRTQCRATYLDGALHGRVERFYEDGSRFVIAYYRKGTLHGAYDEYSGERHVRAKYDGGSLHGRFEVTRGRDVSRRVFDHGKIVSLDGAVVFARTDEAIRERLTQIETVDETSVAKATAAEDALALERMRGLARLNAYRYLCGIPCDVVLDPAFNAYTDAAASLCKAIGRLDHKPPNPGWPKDRFEFGFEGTSHSNLAVTSSLPSSIDQYMNDSDPSNIDRIGHRRWCLNPTMAKTGLGRDERFAAMWSMDGSRKSTPRLDFVSYPPAGFVPIEYFGPRHAWSITFSASTSHKKLAESEIRLYRLDERFLRVGEALPFDACHVAAGGFGGGGACLVFRSPKAEIAPGARYEVAVMTGGDKRRSVLANSIVEFTQRPAEVK